MSFVWRDPSARHRQALLSDSTDGDIQSKRFAQDLRVAYRDELRHLSLLKTDSRRFGGEWRALHALELSPSPLDGLGTHFQTPPLQGRERILYSPNRHSAGCAGIAGQRVSGKALGHHSTSLLRVRDLFVAPAHPTRMRGE